MTTDNPQPAPRPRLTWRTAVVAAAITAPGAFVVDALLFRTTRTGFEFGPNGRMSEVSLVWILLATTAALVIGCRPWRLFYSREHVDIDAPWRADVGRLDRARVDWAVLRYDFWLDWHDTPRGRRAPARRELRANLQAATEAGSASQAVADLGNIRVLAAETVAGLRPRAATRASAGIVAAGIGLIVIEILWIVTVAAFADGAMATGEAGSATGRVLGLPTTVVWSPEEFSIESTFSWVVLLVPLVLFVIVARPWRLLRTRRPISLRPDSRR